MYRIAYKSVSEIKYNYDIITFPDEESIIYECILIDGIQRTAKFIKTNIRYYSNPPESLLKRTVRCYIINSSDIPNTFTISQILERYG